MKKSYLFAIFLSSILITACGGGGGSSNGGGNNGGGDNGGGSTSNPHALSSFNGSTSAATASSDNSVLLSEGATIATSRMVQAENTPQQPFGASLQPVNQIILDLSFEKLEEALVTADLPSGFITELACTGGGSIIIEFVGVSENTTPLPETGTIIYDYNDCDYIEIFIDGEMTIEYTGGFDLTNGPQNFTTLFDFVVNGDSYSGSLYCTDYGNSCSFAENYSEGGRSYRIENSTLIDNGGSYSVTATVYDEEEGHFDITATGITIDSNNNVCTGSIFLTDSTGAEVLSVTFPDCSEFIVTFEGVATSYQQ